MSPERTGWKLQKKCVRVLGDNFEGMKLKEIHIPIAPFYYACLFQSLLEQVKDSLIEAVTPSWLSEIVTGSPRQSQSESSLEEDQVSLYFVFLFDRLVKDART